MMKETKQMVNVFNRISKYLRKTNHNVRQVSLRPDGIMVKINCTQILWYYYVPSIDSIDSYPDAVLYKRLRLFLFGHVGTTKNRSFFDVFKDVQDIGYLSSIGKPHSIEEISVKLDLLGL